METCLKCKCKVKDILYLDNEPHCTRCTLYTCAKYYASNQDRDALLEVRQLATDNNMREYFDTLFNLFLGKVETAKPVFSMFNLLSQLIQTNNDILSDCGIEYQLGYNQDAEKIIITEIDHNTSKHNQVCAVYGSETAYILYLQAVALQLCEIEL